MLCGCCAVPGARGGLGGRARGAHYAPAMSISGSSLGRLVPVAPRSVWAHEAQNFTPWLLANADVLSDLLGMDLELDAAEHPVGGFYLDLVGKDAATGDRVIVENQL